MSKIPLIETHLSKFTLCESVSKDNVLCTIKGIFAQYDTGSGHNRNNRKYSRKLWEKVINSDYVKEMMTNKCLFGEADHPENRMNIYIPEVSHCITKMEVKDDGFIYGEADILDTPTGRIVHTLVKYGSILGISSRAEGSVAVENGVQVVNEDDYQFYTFDIVPRPSVSRARLTEGLNETNVKKINESFEEQINKANFMELKLMRNVLSVSESHKPLVKLIDSKLQTLPGTFSALEEVHCRLFTIEKENERLRMENKFLRESQPVSPQLEVLSEDALSLSHRSDMLDLIESYDSLIESKLSATKDTLQKVFNRELSALKEKYESIISAKDDLYSALLSREIVLSESFDKVVAENKLLVSIKENLENRNQELTGLMAKTEHSFMDLENSYKLVKDNYDKLMENGRFSKRNADQVNGINAQLEKTNEALRSELDELRVRVADSEKVLAETKQKHVESANQISDLSKLNADFSASSRQLSDQVKILKDSLYRVVTSLGSGIDFNVLLENILAGKDVLSLVSSKVIPEKPQINESVVPTNNIESDNGIDLVGLLTKLK